ncbi:heme o synthase [Vibrio nigripulchritudo]|uniref:heme o synthase n=1 Tax=Vibrio nigripulchritudo TaxID=28173 RepID=UPI0003B1B46F|nr:heme o synthase [Vibrio nigripulchritudo]CCN46088.1 Protohaem IX farnesyltransferase [Vibrio nigripulchritudo MADA3020]CCN51704.1 Protohaem IX farnesyltransferase [Vibrio nigripulchritudo MADA3021]
MDKSITQTSVEGSTWRDYYTLTKPKVVALMLLTTVVGMILATDGYFPLTQALIALAGIGLMASSAAAFNHLVDRRIDAIMARTYQRPLPTGQVKAVNAFAFAVVLGVLGFVALYWQVNELTAWLTLASLVGYALVYTLYLKRATPQNIVIAGIAGAMPPLLGWTAVTNELHSHAWLLVMIIFIWTPPHFWALAIHRKEDYSRADIPMLPVTHGVEYTKTSILLYTILLAIACLFPVLVGMSGLLYLIASSFLSAGFIYKAWKLKYREEEGDAMRTFIFSIYQLMFLFVALLADHFLR